MARCQATTNSGDQCKREAEEGRDYCYQHGPEGKSSPYKFDPKARERFIEHLEKGATISTAAQAEGVCRQTVYDHREKNEEFDKAVGEAVAGVDMQVEAALHMEAMDGNLSAMMRWLHNRRPETWRDQDPEEGEQPINVNVRQSQKQAQESKNEKNEAIREALENDPELREHYKQFRRRVVEIE